MHELLKDDLLKCEKYSEEARFLSKNKIVTDQDLRQAKALRGGGNLK